MCATNGKHERKAKFRAIGRVEFLDAPKFIRRALGKASLCLFVGGFGSQRVANHGLAGEFRVGADQLDLRIAPGLFHDLRHDMLEMRRRSKRPLLQGLVSYPWRVLVEAIQHGLRVFE